MRILTTDFVNQYAGRLMNIHPSLLPLYPGLNTHQRAIDNGDKEAGATVHFVTPEVDGGPVIIQAHVPVLDTDSCEDLSSRVLEQEHQIYPRAIQWFSQGRLTIDNGKVLLDGKSSPQQQVFIDEN
jgi:phosphoribosylglycinamide formyltransferase-1